MVIKCFNCDKNDFKSERGFNCYILWIYLSSVDGRGLWLFIDICGRRDDKVRIIIYVIDKK